MAITRQKKEEILTRLREIIKSSKSVVFLNFHGLKVEEAVSLRKELKQSNIGYLVAKKTLLKKAFENLDAEGEKPSLKGELSLAYGEDSIEPARKVFLFQKKLDDKVTITGGFMDGRFISEDDMTNIAKIPSRETLYAQFVNLVNSPIQQLVTGLEQIAKSKS